MTWRTKRQVSLMEIKMAKRGHRSGDDTRTLVTVGSPNVSPVLNAIELKRLRRRRARMENDPEYAAKVRLNMKLAATRHPRGKKKVTLARFSWDEEKS